MAVAGCGCSGVERLCGLGQATVTGGTAGKSLEVPLFYSVTEGFELLAFDFRLLRVGEFAVSGFVSRFADLVASPWLLLCSSRVLTLRRTRRANEPAALALGLIALRLAFKRNTPNCHRLLGVLFDDGLS